MLCSSLKEIPFLQLEGWGSNPALREAFSKQYFGHFRGKRTVRNVRPVTDLACSAWCLLDVQSACFSESQATRQVKAKREKTHHSGGGLDAQS